MTPWYKSKQFWFNVLAVVVALAAAFGYQEFVPDPRITLIAQALVAAINVILRFLVPSQPPQPTLPSGVKLALPPDPQLAKTRHDNATAAIVFTMFALAGVIGGIANL